MCRGNKKECTYIPSRNVKIADYNLCAIDPPNQYEYITLYNPE